MKFIPETIRPGESGTLNTLDRVIAPIEEALAQVDRDNVDEIGIDYTEVEIGAVEEVCNLITEVEVTPDPTTYYGSLPYDTDGVWDGPSALGLSFAHEWTQVEGVEVTTITREGFLQVLFSAQVSGNLIRSAVPQFALSIDGQVLEETAENGIQQAGDPRAGFGYAERPVLVQGIIPVAQGQHTVSVVYRFVATVYTNYGISTDSRVLSRELILVSL
jgi:hypothetical protein